MRRFPEGTTAADLMSYMAPFVEHLGFKFNTDEAFVAAVLDGELEILARDGDVFCPCRVRTRDPKQDAAVVCPCIPYYLDDFWAMRKCWCGLFIRRDVEDGSSLHGVVERPEGPVEVRLAALPDIVEGSGRVIRVGRRELVVVNVAGEVFALDNACRHMGGSLGNGYVDGYEVVCPLHGWRFDVRDGSTDHPGANVRTYPATVRDGEVFVVV